MGRVLWFRLHPSGCYACREMFGEDDQETKTSNITSNGVTCFVLFSFQISVQRICSFIKRLSSISLQLSPGVALAVMATVRLFMQVSHTVFGFYAIIIYAK